MDIGIIVTVTGVVVAGFAAVLGIWMERDERKPPRYAYALSALILLATVVSVMQTWLDAKAGEKLEQDMARMLLRLDKLASESDNPELMAFIGEELNAQARANPDVVEKIAQRVSDEGGDPATMLGKHIDAAELEDISRKGLMKTKKKESEGGGGKKKDKDKDRDKDEKKALSKEEKAERKADRADAKEAKQEARQMAKNWDELTKEEKQALKGEMTKEEKQALKDAKQALEKKEAKSNWDKLSKDEKQKWKEKYGKDADDKKGGGDDGPKTAADAKGGKKKGKDDKKAGDKKAGDKKDKKDKKGKDKKK